MKKLLTEKKLHVIFKGSVQGVGFRYTTQRISEHYQVTGFVKNLPDGTVELLAEGDSQTLQDFLKAICESSLAGCIRDKNVEWGPAEGHFNHFEIAR